MLAVVRRVDSEGTGNDEHGAAAVDVHFMAGTSENVKTTPS
ncbi:MAG TPA: hypothetical protein VFG03_05815 [Telluria sp.]|nr:hypothetical protein [Telluria sp.]